MDSFKAIIDAYSVAKLSEVLGLPESHVRTMRARDSIPAAYWPILVESAPGGLRGAVTLESLFDLRNRRFSEPKARASHAEPAQ
jgi:hypothetical protein